MDKEGYEEAVRQDGSIVERGSVRDAVEQDEIGLKSARNTGIRVAKTVLRYAK